MIINNASKSTTGNWTFDLQITNEEVEQLVNLSIQTLILEGTIRLIEQEEGQEVSIPTQNAPTSKEIQ